MGTLISNASALLTGAATFAAVETGTGALALVRNTTTIVNINASTNSSTFTITNGKVIDGVLLWLKNGAAASGTIKVALQLSGVDQASVTVNKADLPLSANANPSPVFFKFTSTATGDGSANWRIQLTLNNVGSALTFNIDSSTTSDFTRALRTTTAGTPGAADDVYVVGELTGAGTNNPITVTMDQTAATIYGSGVLNTTSAAGGGIHVGKLGTLQFDTTQNTLLYVNGDVNVWDGGTYNQGTSGTPVPITKTATLKFKQNTLDGDFGLIGNDGGTINTYGVPRTAGKLVVKCLLNADFSSANLVVSNGGTTVTNGSAINPITNAAGIYTSYGAIAFTDNATATVFHSLSWSSVSTSASTFTHRFWVARGSGTNNRFIRCGSNSTNVAAPAQGFYVDVDLQAGTIGATGTFGTSTLTSSSIAAQDGGYLITVTGNNGASTTNSPFIASASALGTITYTGNTTQCFVARQVESYRASSIPAQTSLTVDTDTGWLAGDLIALASTTRTIQDCEPAVLTSNAGASSLATTLNVLYAHSGTSPTQAEVINLTRNVKICSDSAALMTYCSFSALCTLNMQWTEVFYCGTTTAGKYGLGVFAGAATNPKSITYCSLHDCKGFGLGNNASNTSWNLTFSNNTLWNVSVSSGPAIGNNTTVLTDWTMDNNTLIRTYNGNAWTLSDVGGTFTNNTAAGAASVGISYQEGNTIGTHTGNTAHSNGGIGCQLASSGINGVIGTLASWRNSSAGFNSSSAAIQVIDFTLDTPIMFGNSVANLAFSGASTVTLLSPTLNGDSTFSTATGFTITADNVSLKISNGAFGVASGIKTAHTQDFLINAVSDFRAILLNTTLGSATEIATPQNLAYSGYISSEKADQTAGNHFTVSRNGKVQTDSVIFHTASPSMRMTPASALTIGATITNGSGVVNVTSWTNGLNWASLYVGQLVSVSAGFAATLQAISSFSQSAGTITFGNAATGATGAAATLTPFLKLESAPKDKGMLVPTASGVSKTISVYVRKSVVGDGTAYNGAQPRLIQRANAAIGINADIVLATASGAAGSWELLTATATAPSGDDGALEFVVDVDGTAGWVNVDDWSFS